MGAVPICMRERELGHRIPAALPQPWNAASRITLHYNENLFPACCSDTNKRTLTLSIFCVFFSPVGALPLLILHSNSSFPRTAVDVRHSQVRYTKVRHTLSRFNAKILPIIIVAIRHVHFLLKYAPAPIKL